MPVVRVKYRQDGAEAVTEWAGDLVAQSRSDINPLRWVEMSLYRLDRGGWMLHRIGMSKVYHRADTLCRTGPRRDRIPGDIAKPSDLPSDADPCYICEPPYPERLQAGEQVRFEFPRHTFTRCRTALQIQKALTTFRHSESGLKVTKISWPVRDLLAQAAGKEPDFAALGPVTETIEPTTTTSGDMP